MERIPARRCSSFFAVLVAVAFFVAGKTSLAQTASSGTSSQPQEFSQNVKEVYFPFNVYKKINNPAVLDQDAAWLKQHSEANFWIQGYADVRGDIFYNLVLSYRRAQFVKTSLVNRGVSESQIGFATGWGKLYPGLRRDKVQFRVRPKEPQREYGAA